MNYENRNGKQAPKITNEANKPEHSGKRKKPAPIRVQMTGVYKRTKMRNFANGYTVFDILTETGIVTCTGHILAPCKGVYVNVIGEWVDSKHGRQLQKVHMQTAVHTPKTIYEFLSHIPGIGYITARDVSEKLNMSLNDLVHTATPVQTLVDLTGIRRDFANTIIEYTTLNNDKATLYAMLDQAPAGYAIVERMMKTYGKAALSTFLADPYVVGAKFGVPISLCDYIVSLHGYIEYEDPRRLASCAITALRGCDNDGDSCMSLRELAGNVRRFVSGDDSPAPVTPTTIMAADAILTNDTMLCVDDGYVYRRPSFWDEVRTAAGIRRIVRSGIKADCDPDELCDYAESVCGVKYAEQQRAAFRAFRTGGVCILTGGPGTGKTTVVKGLIAAYEKLYPENTVVLCAPTGRAAQRMKEATGREASTVHRLLDYKPYGDSFSCKNEGSPIEADLIIVDESSMISIDLSALFFSAVRSGTMVLLVGDTDQLPSVGPGNVLADVIRSGLVPVYALTKTHRQGAGSPIIENAHRISDGRDDFVTGRDFIMEKCSVERIREILNNVYFQYHDPADPFAVQILTTTRKDPVMGCNGINKIVQGLVNPNHEKGVRYGDTVFYVGDKVMMTRNNYEIGYFNGDIGLIRTATPYEIVVEINGEMVHVPTDLLEDMSLAYACTIHKSQGSEYTVAIVIIPNTPASMLQRNILYTAITRAKKRVILISSEEAIFTCVNTVTSTQRVTRLAERLRTRELDVTAAFYEHSEAGAKKLKEDTTHASF